MGCFWNTGQVCTAVKRIYIHEHIYPQMLGALAKAAQKFKITPDSEGGGPMGPIQNEVQYKKVRKLFEESRHSGYNVTVGGQVNEHKGFFLEPTIIDNPPPDSKLVTEEQFVSH